MKKIAMLLALMSATGALAQVTVQTNLHHHVGGGITLGSHYLGTNALEGAVDYQGGSLRVKGPEGWESLVATVALDQVTDPTTDTVLSLADNTVTFNFTNPSGGMAFNFTGAFAGHSFTLSQSGGNPGADAHMLHIQMSDPDPLGIHVEHAASTGRVFAVDVIGDAERRFNLDAAGKMEWGDGSGAADVSLERDSAGSLTVVGAFNATSLTGDGSGLTNLPIPEGLWTDDGDGSISRTGTVTVGTLEADTISGDGSGLTNLSIPESLWTNDGDGTISRTGTVTVGTLEAGTISGELEDGATIEAGSGKTGIVTDDFLSPSHNSYTYRVNANEYIYMVFEALATDTLRGVYLGGWGDDAGGRTVEVFSEDLSTLHDSVSQPETGDNCYVEFDPPIPITAGEVFVIRYHYTTGGHQSYHEGNSWASDSRTNSRYIYFHDADVTPLSAPHTWSVESVPGLRYGIKPVLYWGGTGYQSVNKVTLGNKIISSTADGAMNLNVDYQSILHAGSGIPANILEHHFTEDFGTGTGFNDVANDLEFNNVCLYEANQDLTLNGVRLYLSNTYGQNPTHINLRVWDESAFHVLGQVSKPISLTGSYEEVEILLDEALSISDGDRFLLDFYTSGGTASGTIRVKDMGGRTVSGSGTYTTYHACWEVWESWQGGNPFVFTGDAWNSLADSADTAVQLILGGNGYSPSHRIKAGGGVDVAVSEGVASVSVGALVVSGVSATAANGQHIHFTADALDATCPASPTVGWKFWVTNQDGDHTFEVEPHAGGQLWQVNAADPLVADTHLQITNGTATVWWDGSYWMVEGQ